MKTLTGDERWIPTDKILILCLASVGSIPCSGMKNHCTREFKADLSRADDANDYETYTVIMRIYGVEHRLLRHVIYKKNNAEITFFNFDSV